jgi:hypothetical protein
MEELMQMEATALFTEANKRDGSNVDGREMHLPEFRKGLQLVGQKIGIPLENDENIVPLLPSSRSVSTQNRRSTSPPKRGANRNSPPRSLSPRGPRKLLQASTKVPHVLKLSQRSEPKSTHQKDSSQSPSQSPRKD